MVLKIQTEQFEGPLDLLLQLIEKEKLDITQISLAKITDQYLEIIKKLNPESHDIAEFVLIASKLLSIKSKALLPHLNTEEEEDEIEDLEEKLREYKIYKEAAEKMNEKIEEGFRSFKKGYNHALIKVHSFTPPANLDLKGLFQIMTQVLAQTKEETEEKEGERVFEKLVTVEEKRFEIHNHIKKQKKISFKDLLKVAKTKHEVVVSFLAILDLIKQKSIKVAQEENFGDIMIEVN